MSFTAYYCIGKCLLPFMYLFINQCMYSPARNVSTITKHRYCQKKEQWGKIVAFFHFMELFLTYLEVITLQSGTAKYFFKNLKKNKKEKKKKLVKLFLISHHPNT